jgi:hypothetical protein
VTAIPCGPGVAHCACVAGLIAELDAIHASRVEVADKLAAASSENEKLRALLAEWVEGAYVAGAFFQALARRTVALLSQFPETPSKI